MNIGRRVIGAWRSGAGSGKQSILNQLSSGVFLLSLRPHASCVVFSIHTSSFLLADRWFVLLYTHGCPIAQVRISQFQAPSQVFQHPKFPSKFPGERIWLSAWNLIPISHGVQRMREGNGVGLGGWSHRKSKDYSEPTSEGGEGTIF